MIKILIFRLCGIAEGRPKPSRVREFTQMCEAIAARVSISHLKTLRQVFDAANEILSGQIEIDPEDDDDSTCMRRIHDILNAESDRFERTRISPPDKISGKAVHVMKVRVKSFMLSKGIKTTSELI